MRSKIEQQVMAGVWIIYTVRKLTSRTAVELYVLGLSALALWRLIWVHKVLDNFFSVESHGISAVGNYLMVAVSHTQLSVQLTLVVAAVALIALCVDAARSFGSRELSY